MELKGLDKLLEKLPAYPGRRFALLPLLAALGALLAYFFIFTLEIAPRLFSDITILVMIEPILPFVGGLVIAALVSWLLSRMWNKRKDMKERFGDLAYQKMFPQGLTGVGMAFSLVAHAFTSVRSLPPDYPVNELTNQLSRSLLPLMGITTEIDIWIRLLLSGIFFLFGIATMRSSILTFGLDYMAVVYLYFPEESEVQDHAIYSVIRHPTYLGGVLIGAAGLFFRFSIYSIFFAFLVYLVFRTQISREEKELIERFGEGYDDYRKRVPAFIVRPNKFREYLRFLRETI